jgi:hypothetical protein
MSSSRLEAIVRCTRWAEECNRAGSPMALIGGEHEGVPVSDADEHISSVFDGLREALASRIGTVA